MICFRHLLYPILSENNEYLRLVISATVAGLLSIAMQPSLARHGPYLRWPSLQIPPFFSLIGSLLIDGDERAFGGLPMIR